MPETWGLGQLVTSIRETSEDNTRLGRALVLFGVLSFVGGVGILAVIETFRMGPSEIWTYRQLAGGLAGVGLPGFLFGLVVLAGGNGRAIDVSGVGVLLCTLAVLAFFVLSPGSSGTGVSAYGVVALAAYGLGTMTCSFAAGVAVLVRLSLDGESELTPDETGFIWGNPPGS